MNASILSTRRPIAAVITDGPEAAAVARHAAELALTQHRPVVLLVPLRRATFTTEAVIATRVQQTALREAEAIAARARPALDAAGVSAHLQVVWHRTCPFRRAHQARAIAVAHAAHRVGAAVIVTPATLPVPTVKHGAEVLLIATTAGSLITVRHPARSRGLSDL